MCVMTLKDLHFLITFMEILFKKHPTFSEAVMAGKVKHGGLHLLCYKQNFKDLSKVKRVKNWK